MGEEIISAALAKFRWKVRGPISSVGFEGIGEDGVGWSGSEGSNEGFAHGFEVCGYSLVAEGIEDPAFSSYGGSFNLLMCVGLDEEEGCTWGGLCRDAADLVGVEGLGGGGVPMLGLPVHESNGDDGFALCEFEFW